MWKCELDSENTRQTVQNRCEVGRALLESEATEDDDNLRYGDCNEECGDGAEGEATADRLGDFAGTKR